MRQRIKKNKDFYDSFWYKNSFAKKSFMFYLLKTKKKSLVSIKQLLKYK